MKFFKKNKTQKLKLEIELIEREIHRSKRFGYLFSFLLLEVTNSTPRGLSKFLPGKTLSFHLLQKNLRQYDKIVNFLIRRYYIILPQTSKSGSEKVKKRIIKLAELHNWGKVNLAIATYPEDGINAKTLIKKATTLLEEFISEKYEKKFTSELTKV
jgi:hypothetical protein